MTKEEKQKAIDALKISTPNMPVTQEKFMDYVRIIHKIIDWLEQEPCDDVISRQAALNCLTASDLKKFDFILDARNKIKNLPPAKPQPKGYWVEHPKGIYAHLVCDKCLSNAPYDCRTNYCPNCGAKMESEENE